MSIQKFIGQISSVLNQLKIPHIISGGIAVSVWGRPRHTADVDIVIEIESVKLIESLTKQFKKVFPKSYADTEMAINAFKRKSEFNIIEPEYGLKADFFISNDSEYGKLAMRRGKLKKVDGQMIRFVSAEDLIISKLKWFKEGQSTRQLEDIASVIDVQEKLDQKYLKLWIGKLELSKEWKALEKLRTA